MTGVWLPEMKATHRDHVRAVEHGLRPATHGIVLHDMEGTLESALSWFKNPQAGGIGAHLLVGPQFATQIADLRAKCWHAVQANTYFIGIEHEGYARWTSKQWLAHGDEIEISAHRAAWMLHEFHLGAPHFGHNIFRHSDGGNAWGGHHDPGNGFPLHTWLNICHDAYENHWGRRD